MKFQVAAFFAIVAGVLGAQDESAKPKLWKPSGKRAFDPWKKFCGAKPCYDVLEVAQDATEEQVRKSYRKLAREWHPDKNPEKGAREKFQKIAKAYEVLSTEGSRATYDNLMKNPAVLINCHLPLKVTTWSPLTLLYVS